MIASVNWGPHLVASGDESRALEIQCESRQRMCEDVVHLAGQSLPFTERCGFGLRGS